MRFPRNAKITQKRILDAVGQLLAEKGFDAVGINAIAERAKCDKVLIYRYFDGLPTLLRRYAEQSDFWPTIDALLGDCDRSNLAEAAPYVFHQLIVELRKRPITIEVMRWETAQTNELTQTLSDVKERQGTKLMGLLLGDGGNESDKLDLQAVAAIITGGIYHLLLRERGTTHYLGMDLRAPETWDRISAAATMLARLAINASR